MLRFLLLLFHQNRHYGHDRCQCVRFDASSSISFMEFKRFWAIRWDLRTSHALRIRSTQWYQMLCRCTVSQSLSPSLSRSACCSSVFVRAMKSDFLAFTQFIQMKANKFENFISGRKNQTRLEFARFAKQICCFIVWAIEKNCLFLLYCRQFVCLSNGLYQYIFAYSYSMINNRVAVCMLSIH